jgi:Xaa-Pro aminopeptidase
MLREGLDGVLVFGEYEDAGPAPFSYDMWFTNGRAGATVIFPPTGELVQLLPAPMFVMDHLESSRRGDIIWFPPQSLRGSRDSGAIAETLNELGLAKGTIGVVGLEPALPWHPEGIMPYGLWNNIVTRFPDAEFRPVGLALGQLMLRLGDEEIAAVRQSADIGEAMVRAMVETAAPGVPESEVYAAGMAAGYARGTVPGAMHLWSGPDVIATGWPAWGYRPQAPRILRDGDVIYSEVFSNFGGRHTQHQVTITIGEVHPEFYRAAEVVRASYDAGLQALRPGRTFGDVVEAMHKPIEAADGSMFTIVVHSLNPGLALGRGYDHINRIPGTEGYPPAHAHPAFLPEMELQPGMSFALEPAFATGHYMAHVGTTVIVGEDEPTELSPYTAQLLPAAGQARPPKK